MPLFLFFKGRLKDPLFYLSAILLSFWLLDTYLLIFVKHTPDQMLWWSRAGLGLSVVALLLRNNFLISTLFCALFIHESLWTVSFLSRLLFQTDKIQYTNYMFGSNFSPVLYMAGLFHLFLVPSLILAIIYTKKIHRWGWVGAALFGGIIMLLSYLVAEPARNLNCVLPDNHYQACHTYLGFFYNLGEAKLLNPYAGMLIIDILLTLFFFLPTGLATIWIGKKFGLKVSGFNFKTL